jgi:hypothetical protein
MRHLIREVSKGLASTKCGLTNQSLFNVTGWWCEVDCPDCRPHEWVDAPPVGKKMVERKRRRRIVRVPG